MKKDNPTATGKELKSLLGELWKKMSDAEKKPYNEQTGILFQIVCINTFHPLIFYNEIHQVIRAGVT
jgi:hypothetical protein